MACHLLRLEQKIIERSVNMQDIVYCNWSLKKLWGPQNSAEGPTDYKTHCQSLVKNHEQ